jgi:hypothetical protein
MGCDSLPKLEEVKMPQEIREIAIEDNMLSTSDVSRIIDLFFIRMTIENAKRLAGTVVLVFPKYDNDSSPNCTIPEIRAYICKLHAEAPRFPFYYVDEATIGAHLSHLACLSPVENIAITENGSSFRLIEISNEVRTMIAAA